MKGSSTAIDVLEHRILGSTWTVSVCLVTSVTCVSMEDCLLQTIFHRASSQDRGLAPYSCSRCFPGAYVFCTRAPLLGSVKVLYSLLISVSSRFLHGASETSHSGCDSRSVWPALLQQWSGSDRVCVCVCVQVQQAVAQAAAQQLQQLQARAATHAHQPTLGEY